MSKRLFGKPVKRKLDQDRIKLFLDQIGFEATIIKQEWRHLVAVGKYKEEPAVFKLASTIKTSAKTRNEFLWNEAVNRLPEKERMVVTVPKNLISGDYEGKFYFISEQFEGRPILERGERPSPEIIELLPTIAKVAFEIENFSFPANDPLVMRQMKKSKLSPGERLLASSTEWASQVPMDLDKYLKIIEVAKKYVRTCVGHGDFVLRHMYRVGNKIGVIDGEHAGYKGPLYYDPVYFYMTIRTEYDKTLPASDFLNAFRRLLPIADQKTFWEEIKPLLIQKYIGLLWGANKDFKKIEEFAKLGKEILEDKII